MAPTPSGAEHDVETGEGSFMARLQADLRTGASLWLKGLRVVPQPKWVLLFFVASAVSSSAVVAARMAWVRRFLPAWDMKPGRVGQVDWAGLIGSIGWLLISALAWCDWALSLHSGPLVMLFCLVAVVAAWTRIGIRRQQPRPSSKKTVEVAAITLLVLLAASAYAVTLMMMDLRPLFFSPWMELWRYWGLRVSLAIFPVVAAAVLFLTLGRVLHGTIAGRRRPIFDNWTEGFSSVFCYFLIVNMRGVLLVLAPGTPWHMLAILNTPLVFWGLRAAKLATLPLPFLLVALGIGLPRALAELARFYRKRWGEVAGLVGATALLLTVWSLATSEHVVRPFLYHRTLGYFAAQALSAILSLIISLGGVAGMFLLIEDWRTGRKADSFGGEAGSMEKEKADEVGVQ